MQRGKVLGRKLDIISPFKLWQNSFGNKIKSHFLTYTLKEKIQSRSTKQKMMKCSESAQVGLKIMATN